MYLENVVFDATDPAALGRFWEAALGTETLTDEWEGFETRLAVPDGPVLDLCFQRVTEVAGPQRVRLDLRGGDVPRLLALGATRPDADPQAPGTILTDLEGNALCVLDERAAHDDTGLVAALTLQVADPDRDRSFWGWLTGWTAVDGDGPPALRHPSRRGPVLELAPETQPKGPAKSRIHLDVRLEPGEEADSVAEEIVDRGGQEFQHDWGDLPWRTFTDPSGNEFCVLPAPR